MVYFVMVLGLLMVAVGLFGLAAPARMAAMAGGVTFSESMRYLAAFGRFAIGIILYFAAYQTKFSLAIQVLAMLSVFSGIVPLLMSRATLQQWLDRVPAWPPGALRGIGAGAAVVGAFVFYAAV